MSKSQNSPQKTISSYFSSPVKQVATNKRSKTEIDLTLESDDEQHPPKRLRTQTNAPPPVSNTATSATRLPPTQWAFSGNEASQSTQSNAKTPSQLRRHEAFKRKLLGDSKHFQRKNRNDLVASDNDDAEADGEGVQESASREGSNPLFDLFSSNPGGKGGSKTTKASQTKKQQAVGPRGYPYSPLELQLLELKKKNPGTLLMIEVGYKYRFFGKDAEIASRELGIMAFPNRNFMRASVPTERRDVHLKKLLSQGHRVGIVRQLETAALKKISDNRNTLFERQLTQVYTQSTYVDDLNSLDDVARYSSSFLMTLIEDPNGKKSIDVSIGMLTICPNTGDVVWDDFNDNAMRTELETRLAHIRPTELLMPEGDISQETSTILTHFAGVTAARTDKFKQRMGYSEAFAKISDFYTTKGKNNPGASEAFKTGKLMASVTDLPQRVVIALGHALEHLSSYDVADAFLETKFFSRFTNHAHMLLAGNTLNNLEVYRNETDGTVKGSLIWILDKTKTRFGARMLNNWVGRPLVDKALLIARIDAVEEILRCDSEWLLTLRGILKGLPDLAKGLSRIQYGKCTPQELAQLLPAFAKVANAFQDVDGAEAVPLKSVLLKDMIASFPRLKTPVTELLQQIKLPEATEGNKDSMWRNLEKYQGITDAQMAIHQVYSELDDELKSIRKQLHLPGLAWKTILKDDYLVEVKLDHRAVPKDWLLHSKTKNYARLQPPSVKNKVEELAQYSELLAAEASRAYQCFLQEISQNHYAILRDAVNKLATADCLVSLAQIALSEGWVRPEFTDDDTLEIVNGRHPMIEALREDPYVPNSMTMGGQKARSKIVTGPNMGGKSSSVRMVALIAILAQIGSYVPAESCKLGLIDSILTRMGASDDLVRGRSTFMVEMTETSEILRSATNKSLVILDELGRGTSTFDGMAIAQATLEHLVDKVKCKTLFITHYPLVAEKLEKRFPNDVENLHMGYDSALRMDGSREVAFLYRLTTGLASESFGIECGRRANLPEAILSVAIEQSERLQREVNARLKRNKLRRAAQLIQECLSRARSVTEELMEELQSIADSVQQIEDHN